jgi:hypothetical protein
MDLTPFVDSLRRDLASAAELGGDEARALAERLTGPLDSAIRLALLEALSTAADEITRELAPGSVELRLRGREAGFVVTPPPGEPGPAPAAVPPVDPPGPDDEGAMARINFRLPDQLKGRIEEAAGREGLSVNAWLVRVATAAVRGDPGGPADRRAPRSGQRFTGWVQ